MILAEVIVMPKVSALTAFRTMMRQRGGVNKVGSKEYKRLRRAYGIGRYKNL